MKKSLVILAAAVAVASCGRGSEIMPTSLRAEYLSEPVIDIQNPRLSWINEPSNDKVKGASQSAFEIAVSDDLSALKKHKGGKTSAAPGASTVWEPEKDGVIVGRANSRESHLIEYQGSPFESGADYYWKVRVWDSKGKASKWSEVSTWHTGIMDPSEWKAVWIGAPWQGDTVSVENLPAPEFSRTISVDKPVKKAKAFVCGLGYFEMSVNGKKTGDELLVPSFTDYGKRKGLLGRPLSLESNFRKYRTMYMTYDITDALVKGENNVRILVGNGFFDIDHLNRKAAAYGTPRLLCQIAVTYTDGTVETVVSDTSSWKVRESAVRMNDLYLGEIYDAVKEDEPWLTPVQRKAPEGALTTDTAPYDRVTETFAPDSLIKLENGSWKVVFPETISGWIRFKGVRGKEGDTLDVYYPSEEKNGVYKYIFKDSSPVGYAPKFCWYVFDKAIVSGVDSLASDMIIAEAVNTDIKIDAEFSCSDTLFNKINDIWIRTQKDNMHGCIASDCPHREKLPYTGDGQIAMNTVMSNFDAAAFYNKWIADMRNAQDTLSGYVPNGAPWEPYCGGGVAWGSAIDIMPWEFYLRYGDEKMLSDSYFAMKEYVRYLKGWMTPDGTVLSQRTNPGEKEPKYFFNLGDWAPSFGIPSNELVHTFYFWLCASNTAKAAGVLGIKNEQAEYQKVAEEAKEAFHKKFYDSDAKSYGDFGSNVYALVMGVPEDRTEDVRETLRRELTDTYGGHLNTGMLATRFLFEALAENGMNDLAFSIMNKRDIPSFGYWVDNGTTVWEYWNRPEKSHVHPMYGGGLTWFYKCLAGVDSDGSEPAFRHIIVKPVPADGLDWVKYSTTTPYGVLSVMVDYTGSEAVLNVTVPVGSRASVYVPKPDGSYELKEVQQGQYTLQ